MELHVSYFSNRTFSYFVFLPVFDKVGNGLTVYCMSELFLNFCNKVLLRTALARALTPICIGNGLVISYRHQLINNMSQFDSACESFKHVAHGTATLLACNYVFYYIQLLPGAVSRCHIYPSSSSKTRIFPLQYHHSVLGYNIPSCTDICSATGDRRTSDSGNRIILSSVVRCFDGI